MELLHYGYAQPSIDKEAYYIVGLSNIVWNICLMKEYYVIVGCELCLAVNYVSASLFVLYLVTCSYGKSISFKSRCFSQL